MQWYVIAIIFVCLFHVKFANAAADIDECTEGTDSCAQNCHNNIGSYSCSCATGYRLASDGHACNGKH